MEVNAYVHHPGNGDFGAVLNAWHADRSPAAMQPQESASVPPQGANFAGYARKSFGALVDSGAHSGAAN